MKNNMSNLSGNSLNELSRLLYEIDSLINRDYMHVSEYITKNLITSLRKERARIDKEFDKREKEEDNF